jgi:hypothetical protein
MDRETLVNNLLIEAESLEILYPNPVFLKHAIDVWSKERLAVWEKLYQTTILEYNPIENYDRHSTITRTSQSNAGGTVVAAQTSFNSDSFKDTGKSTSNESAGGSETVTDYTHGNIGVRSGQELQAQTREMAMFKWYDVVSDDFIHKFCVQIY